MSILSEDHLVRDLARVLGIPLKQAGRFFRAAVALFKDALLRGHQLDLEEFLSLRIIEEKARIVQQPDTGVRLVEPPRNTVVTTPLPAFEEELARVRLAPILLVVPQNDFFARVVDYHFTQSGWTVVLGHEPGSALEQLGDGLTHLVILDVTLPGAQELLDRLKLRRGTNAVPTIALFPRGHHPDRPERLRIQADQELAEPFEVGELLALAERELVRSAEEELLFEQQVCFILPSTQEALERATELARALLRSSGLDEAGQTEFHAAVREAIGNAIQHGSRADPAKCVRVQYLLDPVRVTVVVRDEGEGFDPRPFLEQARDHSAADAARTRHAQGGKGGLGILMMARAADRMEYSAGGAVVTLTKLLRPAPRPSADDLPVNPSAVSVSTLDERGEPGRVPADDGGYVQPLVDLDKP